MQFHLHTFSYKDLKTKSQALLQADFNMSNFFSRQLSV